MSKWKSLRSQNNACQHLLDARQKNCYNKIGVKADFLYAQLAHLVELTLDVRAVTGSSPVLCTNEIVFKRF